MPRETTYSGMLGDWQRLIGTIEANKAEIPHLEPFLAKLGTVLAQALEVNKRQSALRASKQEASKEMRKLATEGQRLATLARSAIKEHYGIREEKISEFGLQPFRGRARKKTPEAPDPAPAAPTDVKL